MIRFRERFTTPFEQYREREGEPFVVRYVVDEADATHDAEVLPMYGIQFMDGFACEAWPEEVCQ